MEVISYLKSTLLTKDNKCSNPKGHLNPSIYSNNVHNNQVMERAQMSINRCMAKEDVDTHTHTHRNISHQKEWNIAICNNVAGTRVSIMLSEIS